MNWHYSDNGERQIGPVSDAEFQSLLASGAVNSETMVWRDGLKEWTKYGTLTQPATPGFSVATHRCAECGQNFPESDMIAFENSWVCAACKPRFVQKLKEGVAPTGTLQYAGFWVRFGAKFIDGIIMNIMNFTIGLVIGFLFAAGHGGAHGAAKGVSSLLAIFVGAAYVIYFNGRFGATPGKMALKLKIVRPDGSPINYSRAGGRYLGEFVSSIILGIGFMMAGWDPEKRALHDRICDTRVIRQA
jgi:uncharacterized RDD family membrane protein YckC